MKETSGGCLETQSTPVMCIVRQKEVHNELREVSGVFWKIIHTLGPISYTCLCSETKGGVHNERNIWCFINQHLRCILWVMRQRKMELPACNKWALCVTMGYGCIRWPTHQPHPWGRDIKVWQQLVVSNASIFMVCFSTSVWCSFW